MTCSHKCCPFFDLSPTKDIVNIEISMDDDAMDPFVFAVCPKKEEKKLRKANEDLV